MSGSRNEWIYKLLSSDVTVFTPATIRVMLGQETPENLSVLLNRLVKKGVLVNPRRGIYAKPHYVVEELASKIYTPCYVSLEYVLQKAGVIFQFSEAITCVSYKSTAINVDNHLFDYRKIDGKIMIEPTGLIDKGNYTIASPERALLDTMYLNSSCTFDNLRPIKRETVLSILPIYRCKSMEKRIELLFEQ